MATELKKIVKINKLQKKESLYLKKQKFVLQIVWHLHR